VTSTTDHGELDRLAAAFVDLHLGLHAADAPSAPDLTHRLADEIERSGLPPESRAEILRQLGDLRSPSGLCHFDLHAGNVIVTAGGWTVIDWLTAARGPVTADFARTVLLGATAAEPRAAAFVESVRRHGQQRRGIDDEELSAWTRVIAAARLAEGFEGPYRRRLRRVALGAEGAWPKNATFPAT
jgi:Ser/Thr protein kinase RdoA (MazF antagonist)